MSDAPICPDCGKKGKLVDSAVVYGTSYGMIWHCAPCGTYVGCHSKTCEALGTMAGEELRKKRKEAHSVFDPIWQDGRMERTKAYGWLSSRMGVPVDDCHIAKFDEEQCDMVIRLSLHKRGLLGIKRPKR